MSSQTLRRMAAQLRHRGPDDEGYLCHDDVGFAHRRLSIIDPAGSPQPMSNGRGDLHVCFNGEILNYRQLRFETPYDYRTGGDTEVLLALFDQHGPEGVERLVGQFAYALHDQRSGDLWLFRDRMGVIPLYWSFDGTRFLFGSEAKALLAALPAPPPVDEASLSNYLQRRYVPAPHTLFSGIHKLLPGHYLRVGATGPDSPVRYWSLPERKGFRGDTHSAIEGVRSALSRSVQRNLVADVPVGAYLSGGVDSSLIVALASVARRGDPLLTFAAGFGPGSVDELPFARQVAAHVGTDHQEVVLGPDDYERQWAPLTWHRDAPVSEASDIAVHSLAALARQRVKVVLSGEGSDELFAGYPKHRFAGITYAAGIVPRRARQAALLRLEQRLPPARRRLRTAVRAIAAGSESQRYDAWFSSFTGEEAQALLHRREGRTSPVGSALRGDPLTRMLIRDVNGWLPDNLLERADRMSMAASLETRPPFLDPDVVDLAFRLPSSYKLRHGQTKWVVREVARQLLPSTIVDRPKAGFRAPLDNWFRGGLRDMAWSRLLDPASFTSQVLDRRLVEDLLRRHDKAESDEAGRIWNLLALEVWHDVFYASRPTGPQH